ncbi:Conserved_hypothetical protein [Hexamita inflata]|uniref:Hikeshi-like C-terminal domain-containing protein n=1 Tax=Hexamita inflata TaxID=28002 RepID=A0AA86RL14_9EUKA|nr:Conserved hypothetical protein [Hexamita inflata]
MFGLLIPNQPVRTDFVQISDTSMQALIQNVNELTNLTVFNIAAPMPPADFAFSVYLQQSHFDPIFLGQLTPTLHSLSLAISHHIKQRDIDSNGLLIISIEQLMPMQPDQFTDNEKLSMVGKQLAEDMFQFCCSFEDVYFQGQHYIPYQAVEMWMNSVHQRVKMNQKFWNKIQ